MPDVWAVESPISDLQEKPDRWDWKKLKASIVIIIHPEDPNLRYLSAL